MSSGRDEPGLQDVSRRNGAENEEFRVGSRVRGARPGTKMTIEERMSALYIFRRYDHACFD